VIARGSVAINECRWLLVDAFSMEPYEYLASYTAKSMAAQFKKPQNPGSDEAVPEDLGAKLVVADFRLTSMTYSLFMRHPMIRPPPAPR
jgi:hypothetical protein